MFPATLGSSPAASEPDTVRIRVQSVPSVAMRTFPFFETSVEPSPTSASTSRRLTLILITAPTAAPPLPPVTASERRMLMSFESPPARTLISLSALIVTRSPITAFALAWETSTPRVPATAAVPPEPDTEPSTFSMKSLLSAITLIAPSVEITTVSLPIFVFASAFVTATAIVPPAATPLDCCWLADTASDNEMRTISTSFSAVIFTSSNAARLACSPTIAFTSLFVTTTVRLPPIVFLDEP